MAEFALQADGIRKRLYTPKTGNPVGKLTIMGSGLTLEADCSPALLDKIQDGPCQVRGEWCTVFNSFDKVMKHEIVVSDCIYKPAK